MTRRLLLCSALTLLPAAAHADPVQVTAGSVVHAVRQDPGDGLCATIVSVQASQPEVFADTTDATTRLAEPAGQDMVLAKQTAVYTDMRFHNMEATSVGDFQSDPASQFPYDTYFAARLRGYINITGTNQLYTDAIYAVAGARLRVGGNDVIEFNSSSTVRETRQVSFAGPGLYPIEIVYYANGGIAVLEASQALGPQPEGPQQSLDTTVYSLIPGTQLYTGRSAPTTACTECAADSDCGGGTCCFHDWAGGGPGPDGICRAANTAVHCGSSCAACAQPTPYCASTGTDYACVECFQDDQCAVGDRCVNNQCQQGPFCSATGSSCQMGQQCDVFDNCNQPCSSASPCPDGLSCDTRPGRGICVVGPCAVDSDCPAGRTCDPVNKFCVVSARYVGGTGGCSVAPAATLAGHGGSGAAALGLCGLLLAAGALLRRRHRRGAAGSYHRLGGGLAAAIFFSLIPATAQAQNTVLSANAATFQPAIGPDNIIVVDGTAVARPLRPVIMALFAYDYNPLRLLSSNGVTLADTVPHLVGLHLMGGLAFTNWLAIGLDLPIVLYEGFDRRTPEADVPTAPSAFGIADVRLTAKLRIINNKDGGFGLAFAPLITFPSGSGAALRGSDGFDIQPRFALDYRFDGGHLIALNLGFLARTFDQMVPPTSAAIMLVTHEVTYGIGGLLALPKNFALLLDLSGGVAIQTAQGGPLYAPTEMHGAVRWAHRSGFQALLGAGGGFTDAVGSPQFRLFAGLGYLPPGAPGPRERRRLEISKRGTGIGTVESDQPGVRCGDTCVAEFDRGTELVLKATPMPSSEFVGWTGPCSGTDPCALTLRELTQVGAEFRRKPDHGILEVGKTGDGSGRVTSEPADLDCGPSCSGGYAVGVRVRLIPQPERGSEFTGWSGPCSGTQTCEVLITPDMVGYPTRVGAEFRRLDPCKLRVEELIHFAIKSDEIQGDSFQILDHVARTLRHNPGVTIRIEGNTDSQRYRDPCDRHDLNPWLSQQRAESVKRYLIGQGIDPGRLSTIGYGSRYPKSRDTSQYGLAQNRRTEFKRTDGEAQAAACTDVRPKEAPAPIAENPGCGHRRRVRPVTPAQLSPSGAPGQPGAAGQAAAPGQPVNCQPAAPGQPANCAPGQANCAPQPGPGQPAQCIPVVGGQTQQPSGAADVQRAAIQAVALLRAQTGDSSLRLSRVVSARSQVVAGTNYYLDLELSSTRGAVKASVVLFQSLQGKYQLVSHQGP